MAVNNVWQNLVPDIISRCYKLQPVKQQITKILIYDSPDELPTSSNKKFQC